ncbi:MAG: GNAT family N-acetyltransferase [Candidatus Binatia bacterium]
MADMLVKLYELPDVSALVDHLAGEGVVVRPARTPEKPTVLAWMDAHFGFWTREVEAAYGRLPVTCFLAVRQQELLGFSCYDIVCPNFFGPTGVLEAERGKGIGKALLLAALHAQKAQGFAYAIIGGVGPAEYYAKAVGAVMIEGSQPGIYDGLLF